MDDGEIELVAGRFEREWEIGVDARKANELGHRLANIKTYEEYAQACEVVGENNLEATRLFQYWGKEAIGKIYPNIERQRIAITYNSDLAHYKYGVGNPNFPGIDGVDDDYLAVMTRALAASYLKHRPEHYNNRVKMQAGLCEVATGAIQFSAQDNPEYFSFDEVDILNIHMYNPRKKDGAGKLVGTAKGHNIAGFRSGDMVMIVDGGISVMNEDYQENGVKSPLKHEGQYDVEITLLPYKDYQNYLKLRYRLRPDERIVEKVISSHPELV